MKSVTIVIPTYNEEKNIGNCLKSIFAQDYPSKKLQVIVADGGSKDRTREIAKKMGAFVFEKGELINEELRKPYAINTYAKGEIIGLIDADNVVPDEKNWLKKMIAPFDDGEIFASDTLFYTYRDSDSFVTKYNSLIGGDDPIASYLGINDRICYFNNKWTMAPHTEKDCGNYLEVTLTDPKKIPAIGSNGFFFRKKLFDTVPNDPFIHPIFIHELVNAGNRKMAKVKQGIIHVQIPSMKVFFRKKLRRIKRRENGEIQWSYNYGLSKYIAFLYSLYILTLILPLKDMIVGMIRKPTFAWLFHPVASVGLVFIYGFYVLRGKANISQ